MIQVVNICLQKRVVKLNRLEQRLIWKYLTEFHRCLARCPSIVLELTSRTLWLKFRYIKPHTILHTPWETNDFLFSNPQPCEQLGINVRQRSFCTLKKEHLLGTATHQPAVVSQGKCNRFLYTQTISDIMIEMVTNDSCLLLVKKTIINHY